MVHRYVGDDTEFRIHNIGGVQTSAHTHLKHGEIDLLLPKDVEGHSYVHLEKTHA